jgi:hypothetical protein
LSLPRKKLSEEERKKWLAKTKLFSFLTVAITALLFFGNFFLVNKIRDDRNARILREEPTAITTARVIRMSDHVSPRSSARYAVVAYSYNNKTYQQEIRSSRYHVGQEIEIKFSLENPLLFQIIASPKNDSLLLNLLMQH